MGCEPRRGYRSDVACDDEKNQAEVVLQNTRREQGTMGRPRRFTTSHHRGPPCGTAERRCRHCVMPGRAGVTTPGLDIAAAHPPPHTPSPPLPFFPFTVWSVSSNELTSRYATEAILLISFLEFYDELFFYFSLLCCFRNLYEEPPSCIRDAVCHFPPPGNTPFSSHMDPPEVLDSEPPHIHPSSPPTSNTQLAALLSDAFREADSLRRELSIVRKRAEKAERLVQALTPDPTGSPSAHQNGNPQDQKQTVKMLIEDYEERLAQAEIAREEAETRRRVAQESWEQVERYLVLVESRAKDARIAFTRISEGSVAPLVLPPLPPHISTGGGSLSTYPPSSSSQIMAPPNVPSRQHSRHHQSSRHSAAFPILPPHPIPNPNPNLSPSAGTRRPRTPSMDGLYNAAQPPPKRSRANTDDQRTREPRPSYSESVFIFSPSTSSIK